MCPAQHAFRGLCASRKFLLHQRQIVRSKGSDASVHTVQHCNVMACMHVLTKEHDCKTWVWERHLAQSATQIVVAHTFAESFLHARHWDAQQRDMTPVTWVPCAAPGKEHRRCQANEGPLASITNRDDFEIRRTRLSGPHPAHEVTPGSMSRCYFRQMVASVTIVFQDTLLPSIRSAIRIRQVQHERGEGRSSYRLKHGETW